MSCSLGKRGLGKRMVRLFQPRTQALYSALAYSLVKSLGTRLRLLLYQQNYTFCAHGLLKTLA